MRIVPKALVAAAIVLAFFGCNDISLKGVINQELGLGTPAAVAVPTFTPPGGPAGTWASATSVTISTTTAGASIRYTTDGSTPSSTVGTVYTGPINVAVSQTINAIAFASGSPDSTVSTAAFANPATTIRVGSVADSRAATTWTLDGSSMVETRAKLLNLANFGSTGIVTKQILITDTAATINANLLANFDTFFIGTIPNGTLTPTERAALQTWANGGGVMIVTAIDTSHDDVAADFGFPPALHSLFTPPTTSPTGMGITNPMFLTPYGADYPVQMGNQNCFPVAGPVTILATAQDNAFIAVETILLFNPGAGKVVLLSDISMITRTLSNSLSAGSSIMIFGDEFLVDLFNYAHK